MQEAPNWAPCSWLLWSVLTTDSQSTGKIVGWCSWIPLVVPLIIESLWSTGSHGPVGLSPINLTPLDSSPAILHPGSFLHLTRCRTSSFCFEVSAPGYPQDSCLTFRCLSLNIFSELLWAWAPVPGNEESHRMLGGWRDWKEQKADRLASFVSTQVLWNITLTSQRCVSFVYATFF